MNAVKEKLLTYKRVLRDPHATKEDEYKAYDYVKNLIDEHIPEDYIKNIFYARFIQLKPWTIIGLACNGLTNECVRKIVERYIAKLERRLTNEGTKI